LGGFQSIPGGVSKADINSPEIKAAAEFAVKELDKSGESGSSFKQTLVEIQDAQQQVVSGVLYHLKLRLADSNCKRDDVTNSACQLQPDSVSLPPQLRFFKRVPCLSV